MKTITLSIITGLMFILSSCNDFFSKNESGKDALIVSVLEDVTEPDFIASPDPHVVISRFGLDDNKWKSAHFRYSTISQLDYNPREDIVLPSKNDLMENSLLRNKEVSNFKNQIIEVLSREQETSFPQTNSSIFVPILRELQALSNLEADRKELVVLSDLKENSTVYSWYAQRDYQILETDLERVVEIFLQHVPPNFAVNGVSLQIIYIPKDAKDNIEFLKLVEVYKEVFKRLDIPITISANM